MNTAKGQDNMAHTVCTLGIHSITQRENSSTRTVEVLMGLGVSISHEAGQSQYTWSQ